MANETSPKFSPEQVKEHIQGVEKAIEQHRRQTAKDLNFTSVTPEDVARKLERVNSPFIVSQGWNGTTPGGTVSFSLGIYNPDPVQAIWLYAHVWVGSGNVDPVVGTFLNNVDARFPRLTQPDFFGLTLAPGASAILSFSLKVPAAAEKSNYLGNSCLMRLDYHDVGKYLDRSVFPFKVQ